MIPAFGMEKQGYSKEEVDNYIDMIRAEYQKALDINSKLNVELEEGGHALNAQNENMLMSELAKVMEINEVLSAELENSGRALSASGQNLLHNELAKVMEINEVLSLELEKREGLLSAQEQDMLMTEYERTLDENAALAAELAAREQTLNGAPSLEQDDMAEALSAAKKLLEKMEERTVERNASASSFVKARAQEMLGEIEHQADLILNAAKAKAAEVMSLASLSEQEYIEATCAPVQEAPAVVAAAQEIVQENLPKEEIVAQNDFTKDQKGLTTDELCDELKKLKSVLGSFANGGVADAPGIGAAHKAANVGRFGPEVSKQEESDARIISINRDFA